MLIISSYAYRTFAYSFGHVTVKVPCPFLKWVACFCLHFRKIFSLGIALEVDIFSFSTLKISLNCLVAHIVSDEKSVLLIFLPLYVMCLMSLTVCNFYGCF